MPNPISITLDRKSKEVEISISQAIPRIERGLKRAMFDIGGAVSAYGKQLIEEGERHGRFYGSHQASAPGEPPANWTGKLANSFGYTVQGYNEMTFYNDARSDKDAPYPLFLQGGTKNQDGSIRMEPRPFMDVSIEKTTGIAENYILQRTDEEIKK